MPRYFIQGAMSIEPAAHPDNVLVALNRHGAGLTSSNANEGGKVFWVSENVEAATPDAAVAILRNRIDRAAEQRRNVDAVQRFAVGTFVAEHLSEWLLDDEFGPRLGPARWVASRADPHPAAAMVSPRAAKAPDKGSSIGHS